jgi:hypothetical protein
LIMVPMDQYITYYNSPIDLKNQLAKSPLILNELIQR